jgi:multiple sugar transport system substrate-binding protein
MWSGAMTDSVSSKMNKSAAMRPKRRDETRKHLMNALGREFDRTPASPQAKTEMLRILSFLEDLGDEMEDGL